jgi:integrase
MDLSAETVAILREHKRQQAELKLANRPQYVDLGLIFAAAREYADSVTLGSPLSEAYIGRMLDRFVKVTGVRRITHGLRHTSATLLLAAGVQPHVVQRRLGHASIATTLNLYAHPSVHATGRRQQARRVALRSLMLRIRRLDRATIR